MLFQIYRLDKRLIDVVFLLYLSFIWVWWTALASILAFFCSFLIKLLLLSFCNICYDTFLGWPAFFVSIQNFKHVLYAVLLLPSLIGKINSSGLVHSSKVILFSYHQIGVHYNYCKINSLAVAEFVRFFSYIIFLCKFYSQAVL